MRPIGCTDPRSMRAMMRLATLAADRLPSMLVVAVVPVELSLMLAAVPP
jgi:hypothetical protein